VASDVDIILSGFKELKSDVKDEVEKMSSQVGELTKIVNTLVTSDALKEQRLNGIEVQVQSHTRTFRGWRDGALGVGGVGTAAAAIWKFLVEASGGSPPGH
jgi:hypothetical protein